MVSLSLEKPSVPLKAGGLNKIEKTSKKGRDLSSELRAFDDVVSSVPFFFVYIGGRSC